MQIPRTYIVRGKMLTDTDTETDLSAGLAVTLIDTRVGWATASINIFFLARTDSVSGRNRRYQVGLSETDLSQYLRPET